MVGATLVVAQQGSDKPCPYHSLLAIIFVACWENARAFVEVLTKTMGRKKCWTKERIVEEIKKLHEQGIPLNMISVRRVFPSLVATACSKNYFGNWREAVEAAGFNYDEILKVKRWTKEAIIDEIRKLNEQGIDLRPKSVGRIRQGLLMVARSKFGSWAEAVKAAGIDYDSYAQQSRQHEIDADKQRIIDAVLKLYSDGKLEELSGAWKYHLSLCRKARHRFGSWRKAIEAAELDYENIVRRSKWTKESIIAEIRRLYGEGKDLSITAMQREYPTLLFIAQSPKYFGSWRNAIKEAKLDYRSIKRRRGRRPHQPLEPRVGRE